MKYAVYIRAGTEAAARGQHHKLTDYAKVHGLEIVKEYYDIEISGNDLNRPGLQAMIKDYDAGKFERVLVDNYSRLTRKLTAFPFEIELPGCGVVNPLLSTMLDVVPEEMRNNYPDVPKLKIIRSGADMTQQELSDASGVSIRMIQHYEQGVKDINSASALTVFKLAQALGCTVEDLLEK